MKNLFCSLGRRHLDETSYFADSNYLASNGNATSAEEPMEIEVGQFEDADGDPEN